MRGNEFNMRNDKKTNQTSLQNRQISSRGKLRKNSQKSKQL